MATITTISGLDQPANSRAVINTNFSNLNTDISTLNTSKVNTSDIDTTVTLGTSDTKVPSQKATKTYVDTAISGISIPDDQLKIATVSLSSADILALHTTPKELIPAPGVGKINVVEHIFASMTAGGTAYANGGNINTKYNSGSNIIIPFFDKALFINATYKLQLRVAVESASGVGSRLEEGENKSVELSTGTAFINGTGTAKIFIKYRIITL